MSDNDLDSALKGKTIESIWKDTAEYFLAFVCTDGTRVCFKAEADCCARAYFYQLEGAEGLIGQVVTEVQASEVKIEDAVSEGVLDTQWYRFQTPKGEALVIEFRTEHNGYYSGWAERCAMPAGVQFELLAPATAAPIL
jgi:hypothetical protein